MLFFSKRKLRVLVLVLGIAFLIAATTRAVIQFQLGEEVNHYNTYFSTHKDSLHDIYDPLNIKQIPYETINVLYENRVMEEGQRQKSIDWSKFAYVSYATEPEYLCNTVILFEKLKQFGTKAKLVVLVSKDLLDSENSDQIVCERLLERIREVDSEQVVIKLVDEIAKPKDSTPWNKSFTKLLVFNQTEYERIIYLDSDAALFDSMDELFFLPSYVNFAAPLTYWFISESDLQASYKERRSDNKTPVKLESVIKTLNTRAKKGQPIYNHLPSLPSSLVFRSGKIAKEITESNSLLANLFKLRRGTTSSRVKFASDIMVIKPNSLTFQKIAQLLIPNSWGQKEQYDMDLINDGLYNLKEIINSQFLLFRKLRSAFVPEVMVLPFGKYGLLTGSVRERFHHELMANDILGYKKSQDATGPSLDSLVANCKYIHYSDWPINKPWLYSSFDELKCKPKDKNEELDVEMCKTWNSILQGFWDSKHMCQA
ncbi:LANO_0E07382g1_1 [Lachancea nothofagi CBS 11611]|uniref:LANO_0E07382g1_1 n=1 Tax=Lachancea nothofagi CBS 11611 TaxID=1266666 RepID=A0A1G4JUJ8_9SACH|nr:LANO_0E07382g1_1 [Lachancea nothofagi CBS 11611]